MAADEEPQQMRVCGNEVNDAKRLACFDAAIGRTATSGDVGLTGKLLRSKRQKAGLLGALWLGGGHRNQETRVARTR